MLHPSALALLCKEPLANCILLTITPASFISFFLSHIFHPTCILTSLCLISFFLPLRLMLLCLVLIFLPHSWNTNPFFLLTMNSWMDGLCPLLCLVLFGASFGFLFSSYFFLLFLSPSSTLYLNFFFFFFFFFILFFSSSSPLLLVILLPYLINTHLNTQNLILTTTKMCGASIELFICGRIINRAKHEKYRLLNHFLKWPGHFHWKSS